MSNNYEFDNNKYNKIGIEYFDKINTLVLAGGGIKLISTVQTLHTINEHKKDFLKNITSYSGTSGGALVCFVLLLQIDIEDIMKWFEYVYFENVITNNLIGKIYSKNNKGSLSSLIVYKDGSIKKYLIQDKKYFTAITIRFYFFRLYRNFYKLYLIIIN